MSEGYVDFNRITDIAVREDGKEIRLTCQGKDAGEFDMLIPTEALADLIANLQMIHMSASIRRDMYRPVQVRGII